MLRIRLPFPARSLSPNARRVWQASLKPKREAREVGYWAVRQACFRNTNCIMHYNPLYLRIAIHPPDNRRRDLDNIVAALKSYQDGIFDYMHLDDGKIIHKEVVLRRSCPEGRVYYILYQK